MGRFDIVTFKSLGLFCTAQHSRSGLGGYAELWNLDFRTLSTYLFNEQIIRPGPTYFYRNSAHAQSGFNFCSCKKRRRRRRRRRRRTLVFGYKWYGRPTLTTAGFLVCYIVSLSVAAKGGGSGDYRPFCRFVLIRRPVRIVNERNVMVTGKISWGRNVRWAKLPSNVEPRCYSPIGRRRLQVNKSDRMVLNLLPATCACECVSFDCVWQPRQLVVLVVVVYSENQW